MGINIFDVMKKNEPDKIQQKNIDIFASGAGSNTQKIIGYFKNSSSVKIVLVVSNKGDAGVLKIAAKEKISSLIIERKKFDESGYGKELEIYNIDLIVLAGFLWKIPSALIKKYPGRIINIHPALLPKFGGKGMYGDHVHNAVINAKEKQSGITIHYVDEIYDHGKIIFQEKCNIDKNESVSSLANKIHLLEHLHYPLIIESVCKSF